MESTYTLKLGQQLKISHDLIKYMWQKLKPEKPNIVTKVISEPSVTIMINYEIDITTIEVDNHMAII